MTRVFSSLPLLWLILMWPGIDVIRGLFDGSWYYPQMMQQSGVWSIYLLILTVSVTPVTLVLGRLGFGLPVARWLIKRRRHFGLASFVYAALHVAHYLIEEASLAGVLTQAATLEYASGWLAFGLFLTLAVTSNDWALRKLGRRWKALHRWTYAAAGLSFLHWALFEFWIAAVVPWILAFVAVKAVHVGLRRWPRRAVL
ncbi:MAG: ferric reductase-like transmembrane domain-containing protein [Pseudomonadota bacterium]